MDQEKGFKLRPVKESPLVYWVREREAIRLRKGDNPLPAFGRRPVYTKDPILAKYRFCSVRRRHDRVSQWLRSRVLSKEQFEMRDPRDFLVFTGLCRWINWPPTIQAILNRVGWPKGDDYDLVGKVIEDLSGQGQKVWTGAYMIKSSSEYNGRPKSDFIVNEVIYRTLIPNALEILTTINITRSKECTWAHLRSLKQWGSFMSGQVVDDWSWTPLFGPGAKDDFTWAPQGPGSIRGLNRLLMREPITRSFGDEEWLHHLRLIREDLLERLGPSFKDVTLMDIQNCLCETDKYLRAKNGEGRPRSMYTPEAAY